jgi:hypothetical protein
MEMAGNKARWRRILARHFLSFLKKCPDRHNKNKNGDNSKRCDNWNKALILNKFVSSSLVAMAIT